MLRGNLFLQFCSSSFRETSYYIMYWILSAVAELITFCAEAAVESRNTYIPVNYVIRSLRYWYPQINAEVFTRFLSYTGRAIVHYSTFVFPQVWIIWGVLLNDVIHTWHRIDVRGSAKPQTNLLTNNTDVWAS